MRNKHDKQNTRRAQLKVYNTHHTAHTSHTLQEDKAKAKLEAKLLKKQKTMEAKKGKKEKDGEGDDDESGGEEGGDTLPVEQALALMNGTAAMMKGDMKRHLKKGMNFMKDKAAELMEKEDYLKEYDRLLNDTEINIEAFEQILICMKIDLGPLDDDDYEKKLTELFQKYDKDKSGNVNFRELRRAWVDLCEVEKELEKMGITPKTSKWGGPAQWGLKQYNKLQLSMAVEAQDKRMLKEFNESRDAIEEIRKDQRIKRDIRKRHKAEKTGNSALSQKRDIALRNKERKYKIQKEQKER